MPLRRLTSREYLATVRDLLGDTTLALDDVPGESDDLSNNAFPFRQPTAIGTLDAANLQIAAETLAKNMSTKLSTILPCTPASAAAEAGCARHVHHDVRREGVPAAADDRGDDDAEHAVPDRAQDARRSTSTAPSCCCSRRCCRRPDSSTTGRSIRARRSRTARSSSSATTRSPAACRTSCGARCRTRRCSRPPRAGSCRPPTAIQTQVTRMLADSKAQSFVADFIEDWLDVNVLASRPKDAKLYAMWNQDLGDRDGDRVPQLRHHRGAGHRPVRRPADGQQVVGQPGARDGLRRQRHHRHDAQGGHLRRQPARAAS